MGWHAGGPGRRPGGRRARPSDRPLPVAERLRVVERYGLYARPGERGGNGFHAPAHVSLVLVDDVVAREARSVSPAPGVKQKA